MSQLEIAEINQHREIKEIMQIFTDTYYYRPYSLNYSHIHLCQANINTQILVLTQYL